MIINVFISFSAAQKYDLSNIQLQQKLSIEIMVKFGTLLTAANFLINQVKLWKIEEKAEASIL